MNGLYIGLISGTSIDGIDAALINFSNSKPTLLATHSEPIPEDIKQRIIEICTPGDNEIDKLGKLDIELGELFSKAATNLLNQSNTKASDVTAIGSHGQTVRHRPPASNASNGFTLQIADPNTIAERTGITVVADFRRRDMAAHGQGAPFAPAFHQAIIPKNEKTVGFLNLGGIANITLIHQNTLLYGFDTGPANGLMDTWIQRHCNKPYDHNGEWAKTGITNEKLLHQLKSDPYFIKQPPKSTGREEFNLAWLEGMLKEYGHSIADKDVQATLLQLSCTTIADAITSVSQTPNVIYYCGGGAHNTEFIESLKKHLNPIVLKSTEELGIAPDWIEACAFAWFAKQTLSKKAINLASITGSIGDRIFGGVYWA